jgi:hypothetical protein
LKQPPQDHSNRSSQGIATLSNHFCSVIAWQRSIILASVTFFPSAGSADRTWTGDQIAKAKASARLEQMTKFLFVWFLMFHSSLYVFRFCSLSASG